MAEWDGERIKALRTRMGLTVRDFADRVGVSHQSVTNWEKHGMAPNALAVRVLERLERRR